MPCERVQVWEQDDFKAAAKAARVARKEVRRQERLRQEAVREARRPLSTHARLKSIGLHQSTELGRKSTAASEVSASARRTHVGVRVNADGSGFISLNREVDGELVSFALLEFGPEGVPEQGIQAWLSPTVAIELTKGD